MDEDFNLDEGDVITKVLDDVPYIMFSERVKQFIECRIARTIIVKLFRGKIGFTILLNKITLLWNIKISFQLMDLENDYYLMRFQDENVHNMVLVGRPW